LTQTKCWTQATQAACMIVCTVGLQKHMLATKKKLTFDVYVKAF